MVDMYAGEGLIRNQYFRQVTLSRETRDTIYSLTINENEEVFYIVDWQLVTQSVWSKFRSTRQIDNARDTLKDLICQYLHSKDVTEVNELFWLMCDELREYNDKH